MLILKKINNNVALASNGAGEEIVVFGKGVGFPKMPYELEDESVIQRIFADVDEQYMGVAQSVSDDVLLASSDIVSAAGETLDCKLSGNLAFTLADHLQYAIERTAEGIVFENPLASEVRFVYPREVALGARGIEIVRERTGVELPACEDVSIALHLVNSEIDGMGSAQDMGLIMKSAVVLDRATQIIERHLERQLDHSSYAYVRFAAHMRFLIRRLMQGGGQKTQNLGLFGRATQDFPDAYACARDISEYLGEAYGWSCSDEELLYLMMHVNRLR